MPAAERLLIAALSGRALAQSARAAGFCPIVLDRFADLDTRAAAEAVAVVAPGRRGPFAKSALLRAAARLAPPPLPLVWGGGFDGAPDLIAALAHGRELLGNRPGLVRRATDPLAFADICTRLGVPSPAVRLDLPEMREGWLAKRRGASGGWHVRDASTVTRLGLGDYAQRRVEGCPVSLLLLGDGRRCTTLALSEQWQERGRFTGVLVPAAAPEPVATRLREAAVAIAEAHELAGLASADFLLAGDGRFHLLEINARPGASLEAAELAMGVPLIGLHVAACRGALPAAPLRLLPGVAATAIVWADCDLVVPTTFAWPEWAADRTPPGRRVWRGQPLATVRARAADAMAARKLLLARRKALLAAMAARPPPP